MRRNDDAILCARALRVGTDRLIMQINFCSLEPSGESQQIVPHTHIYKKKNRRSATGKRAEMATSETGKYIATKCNGMRLDATTCT